MNIGRRALSAAIGFYAKSVGRGVDLQGLIRQPLVETSSGNSGGQGRRDSHFGERGFAVSAAGCYPSDKLSLEPAQVRNVTLKMPGSKPRAPQMSAMLRLAVTSGNAATIRMHLDRLKHPDVTDTQGRTPLMIAAGHGRVEVCALLLNLGAEPGRTDAQGLSSIDHARAGGHEACADLLEGSARHSRREDVPEDAQDEWLAEDDHVLSAGDFAVARAAAETQASLSRHEGASLDSDWSDVVIEVPTPAPDPRRAGTRRRLSVRFRRSRDSSTRVSGALPSDLGGDANEVLASLSLEQIVLGSDASDDLKRIIRRSGQGGRSGLDFLCDDDAERRLLEDGFSIADYFELADIVNAFTVLAHQLRPVTRTGGVGPAPRSDPQPSQRVRLTEADPEAELRSATLARIVLNGATSPGLRRALARSRFGGMSVDAFLLEEEPERLFDGVLTGKEILELTDLVNAYTSLVFHERGRG